MVFEEKTFKLKDGREAVLRSPGEDDAEEMFRFILKASGETDFLLKTPEDYADFTMEQEKAFLRELYTNEDKLMISCHVNGNLAGNCMICFCDGLKSRHRATVAIGLLQEYWNLGIGTRMFEELLRIAEEREGVCQVELSYIEGNSRARKLYEKMGFRITGVMPDAVRLRDGTFLNEYMMMKKL